MHRGSARALAALITCALAIHGCPGTIDDPEPFVGGGGDASVATCLIGVSNVEAQLIRPRCATSNCHDRGGRAGMLDLQSPGVAARIVGVRSPLCSGRVLVDPSSPGGGYFVEKLTGAPRCGMRMPLGAPALTSSEVSCVRLWLATLTGDAGVPMDGSTDGALDVIAVDRADATVDRSDATADAADAADAPADRRDATVDAIADLSVPLDLPEPEDALDGASPSDAMDVSVDAPADANDAGAPDVRADVPGDVRDASADVRDASADVRDASADVRDAASDSLDASVDVSPDA